MIWLILILIAGIIEGYYRPRFDFSIDGYFLWYGRNERKFVKLN